MILPTFHQAEGDDEVKDTLAYAIRLMAYVTLLTGAHPPRRPSSGSLRWSLTLSRPKDARSPSTRGLLLIALARVQSQVFFADKDQKTPALVAAVVAPVNIVLCLALSQPLGHGGIALAGSVASSTPSSSLGSCGKLSA